MKKWYLWVIAVLVLVIVTMFLYYDTAHFQSFQDLIAIFAALKWYWWAAIFVVALVAVAIASLMIGANAAMAALPFLFLVSAISCNFRKRSD